MPITQWSDVGTFPVTDIKIEYFQAIYKALYERKEFWDYFLQTFLSIPEIEYYDNTDDPALDRKLQWRVISNFLEKIDFSEGSYWDTRFNHITFIEENFNYPVDNEEEMVKWIRAKHSIPNEFGNFIGTDNIGKYGYYHKAEDLDTANDQLIIDFINHAYNFINEMKYYELDILNRVSNLNAPPRHKVVFLGTSETYFTGHNSGPENTRGRVEYFDTVTLTDKVYDNDTAHINGPYSDSDPPLDLYNGEIVLRKVTTQGQITSNNWTYDDLYSATTVRFSQSLSYSRQLYYSRWNEGFDYPRDLCIFGLGNVGDWKKLSFDTFDLDIYLTNESLSEGEFTTYGTPWNNTVSTNQKTLWYSKTGLSVTGMNRIDIESKFISYIEDLSASISLPATLFSDGSSTRYKIVDFTFLCIIKPNYAFHD